jgi:hypothetical protein
LDEIDNEEAVLAVDDRILFAVSVVGEQPENQEESWDVRARIESHGFKKLEKKSKHEEHAI